MIENLLPPGVVGVDTLAEADPDTLFPDERIAVARAVDKRRREFTTVRACARDALAQLGVAPVSILPGTRGAPRWPDGVIGSMTHCEGYRGAVVAPGEDWAAIGIDAEPAGPLPTGVLDAVALVRERRMVARLRVERPDVPWDRLLFSAKESVFKVWYPLMQAELGFDEAAITIDEQGTFDVRLLVDPPQAAGLRISSIAGGWRCAEGFVLTAIVLPPSAVVRLDVGRPERLLLSAAS